MIDFLERAQDRFDDLIAGIGGAIDDERLEWYKNNAFEKFTLEADYLTAKQKVERLTYKKLIED